MDWYDGDWCVLVVDLMYQWLIQDCCLYPTPGGGGGGTLPLEAVWSDAWENKNMEKGCFSGVDAERADRKKGVRVMKNWEKGVSKLLWSEF